MACPLTAIQVDRHDDAGLPGGIVNALEREAAHLTRRDGRRRHIVQWGDDPPSIEEDDPDDHPGLRAVAPVDLV